MTRLLITLAMIAVALWLLGCSPELGEVDPVEGTKVIATLRASYGHFYEKYKLTEYRIHTHGNVSGRTQDGRWVHCAGVWILEAHRD